MKIISMLAATLSLACVSAAEAPVNYRTYHGSIRVNSDPILLSTYRKTVDRCVLQAHGLRRGSPDPTSRYYNAALRNCLYRHGYLDRGVYAYPSRDGFDELFNR